MDSSSGLRKGAWTKEEDDLLRKCIETYGEGRWHLTPIRASLNRCRKSCRLRWLNYLKPDINRSKFTADEVDLMVRLHRLLGNRWSLIAGRLPGRTANDVKNYWNTHLCKKVHSFQKQEKNTSPKDIEVKVHSWQNQQNNAFTNVVKVKAIRPRPYKFPRNLSSTSMKSVVNDTNSEDNIINNIQGISRPPEDDQMLLEKMLLDDDELSYNLAQSRKYHSATQEHAEVEIVGATSVNETTKCWSDLLLDENIWDILNAP